MNLIVRKLERGKLIARSEHETHGRILHVTLTGAGARKLQRCKRLADQTEAKILALLDQHAEATVRRWLSKVAVTLARDKARVRKS